MTMNTNRIIELSLVFFISLFSFSIGTFVGKKYSDNQHRLALLEPSKKTEERQALENTTVNPENTAAATAASTESEITDADVAKLAEEFSEENEEVHGATGDTANAHGGAGGETHPSVAGGKTIKNIKAEVKDVKEVTLSESDEEQDRDVASIPVKAKTMGTYTVQVGSYPTENEANKMTESLLARGYKASAVPANVNGKTMYRVQVGLFNSFSDAQEYKKELMEKNRLTSAFVQKVSK